MKISYKHLSQRILSSPDIDELSERLFHLGHEHEINDQIFDLEITPNRGDCLSVDGLLRDLGLFYDYQENNKIFEKKIDPFEFEFINNVPNQCKKISFLKIVIDEIPDSYKDFMKSYYDDMPNKKNNFFTDVSNYISYETGQPTHCYDSNKLGNYLLLDNVCDGGNFATLLDKDINLIGDDLVFKNKENNIVNLAGVVGGQNTACNIDTKSVIVECAHFNPESIIGKSIKYDISSDAAHKFERNTDSERHEYILRRFLKIIEDHSTIKEAKILNMSFEDTNPIKIPFDCNKLNKILGTNISDKECKNYLTRLGFEIDSNNIEVPSYRNDIKSINDISEEIARSIGYDNINPKTLLVAKERMKDTNNENRLKQLLIDNGFFEVINNPFTHELNENSIKVDNSLDSNKRFLRTSLKNSLTNNLLYNERRQHDSIKLFEISNIYTNALEEEKRLIGIIASGRVDKNYRDFSKKISNNYVKEILESAKINFKKDFIEIPRTSIDSKLKNHISYIEFEIKPELEINYDAQIKDSYEFKKYVPISEFPSSSRDLSFAVKNPSDLIILEDFLLNLDYESLKNIYIFDYYNNHKNQEIKIGFRFTFQSSIETMKDTEINNLMDNIVNQCLKIESVSIPGLEE